MKFCSFFSSQNKIIPFVNIFRDIKKTKPGYLYIVQEREFIKTKENVYKIGKTINMKNRMPSYPKQSILHMCFYCYTNIDVVEKDMIKHFDEHFKNRSDIGREYYEGNLSSMIQLFFQFVPK